MSARNGKIARLPGEIRRQLNLRLEQSEPGPRLLAWLNALPEAREVLAAEFDGAPISRQNLSEWRQGGFEEWRAEGEWRAGFRQVEDFARELGQGRPEVPADAVATYLSVRYAALL